MKKNRLIIAILKTILSMFVMFVIGYLGYHYPDAMVWVIVAAVFCAFSYYFYSKEQED
jgi:hypothetical protein